MSYEELGELFVVDSEVEPHLLPPLVLAYVGDAVFELYVRLQLIHPNCKVQTLHRHAVRYVNASSQSDFLEILIPELTDTENQIAKRGRNAKGAVPRNADVVDYRRSTGFEALIGYLYLSQQNQRLGELLAKLGPFI